MNTLGLDLDPRQPVGDRTVLHQSINYLEVGVARFSHSDDLQFTGNRGTFLTASTGGSGRVHAADLPVVFVADNGDVEVGGLRVSSGIALSWLRAVTEHIEERTPGRVEGQS